MVRGQEKELIYPSLGQGGPSMEFQNRSFVFGIFPSLTPYFSLSLIFFIELKVHYSWG